MQTPSQPPRDPESPFMGRPEYEIGLVVESSPSLDEAIFEIEDKLKDLPDAPHDMIYTGTENLKKWGRIYKTKYTDAKSEPYLTPAIEVVAVTAEYVEQSGCMTYVVVVDTTVGEEGLEEPRCYFIEKYETGDMYLAVSEGEPEFHDGTFVYHVNDRQMTLYDIDQLLRTLDSLDPRTARNTDELDEDDS